MLHNFYVDNWDDGTYTRVRGRTFETVARTHFGRNVEVDLIRETGEHDFTYAVVSGGVLTNRSGDALGHVYPAHDA